MTEPPAFGRNTAKYRWPSRPREQLNPRKSISVHESRPAALNQFLVVFLCDQFTAKAVAIAGLKTVRRFTNYEIARPFDC